MLFRCEMRYQPVTDSLVARIEPLLDLHTPPSHAAETAASLAACDTDDAVTVSTEVVESPDADLSLEWHVSAIGERLHSFHLLHASRRLADHNIAHLWPGLLGAARQLVTDGTPTAATDPATTLSHPRVTTIELSLDHLRRRRPPLDESALDAAGARRVGTALDRLATAIAGLATPSTRLESHRTTHLVLALQELACALVDGEGRTSPGSSSAAHEATRGGVPLSRHEQARVREALDLIDDPGRWHDAVELLEQITSSLPATSH